MVKPAHALVLRSFQLNGTFVSQMSRIQSGFMVESNIQSALQYIAEVQKELTSLQTQIRSDTYTPPPYLSPMK